MDEWGKRANMAAFILVHGAWHGSWCWERIVPLLTSAGHYVLAPDLPGMGDDTTPFAADVLGQWARFIADLARAQDEPVILVGHSRGGLVISQAAELVPERIARLVYLNAFLLPDGTSLDDYLRTDPANPFEKVMTFGADGATSSIRMGARRAAFYHLCSDADARAAMARQCPEPAHSFTGKLHLSKARFGSVPRAYIEASEDQTIPLARQRAMQSVLPCDPVMTLHSDHSPFFSTPEELASALLSLI